MKMEEVSVEELQAALQTYQESLAELELLQTEHSTNETSEVYAELTQAVSATQAALQLLQEQKQLSNNSQALSPNDATDHSSSNDATAQASSPNKRHRQDSSDLQSAKRIRHAAHANSSGQIGPQLQPVHVTQAHATPSHQNTDRHKPAIHPRNKYADQQPDFKALSNTFPELSQHIKINTQGLANIDFRSLAACKALTKALLKHDFNITWDVPDRQLVPPIANRSNYIHWLEDLLQLSSPDGSKPITSLDTGCGSDTIPGPADDCGSETIRGLDIGCGANCIYPLLGAALNGWRFVGTDITDIACEWAKKNVQANAHLQHLIEIRRTGQSSQPMDSANLNQGILLPAVHDGESFAFCMCNPPFFQTLQEAGRNPHTAYGGTPEEMVCPGGELAFVTQMVQDSIKLKGQVHWYTSMLGKKATLKQIRLLLHNSKVTALRTTEFVQGRTSRWGIAWSFAADPKTAHIPMPRYAPAVCAASS